jgi:hypothetical protein
MFSRYFDRVTVPPSGKIVVGSLIWKGVDRPCVEWQKAGNMSLAIGPKETISNVDNYDSIELLTDRYGKTFIAPKSGLAGNL